MGPHASSKSKPASIASCAPLTAASPRLPLDELVARWILSISGSEVRANTAKLYELHMRAHIIDFFGTLDRMTRAQIGNYQRERLRVVMRSTLRKDSSYRAPSCEKRA